MELVLDATKRYTYDDYVTWLDDKRRELIDGVVRLMSPAPKTIHAKTSRKLEFSLLSYIDKNGGACEVFDAPFDVRFKDPDGVIRNTVQPDICIICDPSKIDEAGCIGAPDFIAEILSPRSEKYDWGKKLRIYERFGVKEYWVISPSHQAVTVFILQEDGQYDDGEFYERTDKIPVATLSGLFVDCDKIF